MRRVVVTGMGIISSIGNSLDEVTASLRAAKPGIVAAPDYAELGFRSQVKGDPRLDPFEILARRVTRFMGKGAAWNYLAMQQAIASPLLESTIGGLAPAYRMVFVMREIEGLDTAETAECLEVSEDVVKTRLRRARGMLRKALLQRAGVATAGAFSFHLSRCDRVVAGVLQRITARTH